ncbi:aminoimidazole riboside kinase [Vibrio cincinnatiensis]|uniref:aminoimidazole riboside kinase n=1 Tax=Vibrio cincinnatiensis TaxID=675 RepID=UPI001EDFA703|nr:aminoimidazole riboside kinase [Vibrio cincinnatiensis]MCG3721868.1 aminoimidazole riboside kinase [Vibrio cincinnatiensis]
MNKVWVTGDAVIDLIPHKDGQSYLKCPGGAPANVAVGIARLGGNTSFVGNVGNDPFGHFIAQTLETECVETKFLAFDETYRTSTVVVDLDSEGERTFTFMVNPSADQFFDAADKPDFAANQWLHCCSIALANDPSRTATFNMMTRLKSQGGYISFDPNLREQVWNSVEEMIENVNKAVELADIVKFSEEELLLLSGKNSVDEALANPGWEEKAIIITLGSKGALVQYQGTQTIVPSKAVTKVVDTTGAGDAFVAGLLAQLSRHSEWKNQETIIAAVKCGNQCGALAVTQKGAMTALPAPEQLEILS